MKTNIIFLILITCSMLCKAQISFDFNIHNAWPQLKMQRIPGKLYPEGDPTIDKLRPNGLNFCSHIKVSKKSYLGISYTVQDYDRSYSYRSNQINLGGTGLSATNRAFGASNPFLSLGPVFKTKFKFLGSNFFIQIKAEKGYSIGNKAKLNIDWLNYESGQQDDQVLVYKKLDLNNSKFYVTNALLQKQIPINLYNI